MFYVSVFRVFQDSYMTFSEQRSSNTDGSKDDDELGENPYLAGFEWDREECYTKFIVHQKKTGEEKTSSGGGKKKNKKDKIEE